MLIAGDTHGDAPWCTTLTKLAGRFGCSLIVQVGDFGWWPRARTRSGRSVTVALCESIDEACQRFGVGGWVFIDGNHEDHDQLAVLAGNELDGDGLVPVGPSVRYAPRGSMWTWQRVRFGALGGAVSVDAMLEATGVELPGPPYRVGVTWFPDREAPTRAEAAPLLGAVGLDVLLTHEAPFSVDLGAKGGFDLPPDIAAKAAQPRQLIDEIIERTHPRLVLHGHWHRRYTGSVDGSRVEGLAANLRNSGRDGRTWVILDLDDLTLHDGRTPKGGRITQAPDDIID